MDAFSCLIDDKSADQGFVVIQLHNFSISHLLYADDLWHANLKNINTLKTILAYFHKVSGLCLNPAKSLICCSKGASNSGIPSNLNDIPLQDP